MTAVSLKTAKALFSVAVFTFILVPMATAVVMNALNYPNFLSDTTGFWLTITGIAAVIGTGCLWGEAHEEAEKELELPDKRLLDLEKRVKQLEDKPHLRTVGR